MADNNDNEQATETTTVSPAAPAPSDAPPSPAPAEAPAPAGDQSQQQAEPKSPLEAVQRVLDKGRADAAKPPASAAPGAQPAPQQQTQQPTDDGRLTKEEFDALPPKAKARFNQVWKDAQTYKTNFEKQQPTIKAWNDLQGWARDKGITEDEFSFALSFIAGVRNNPVQAWEMVQPVLEVLRKHVGEVLPEDLQADVTAGTMTPERAQQLARERAERLRLEQQHRQRDGQEQQRVQTERHQQFTAVVTNAIRGYESQWKQSDPDYPKKSERTWERMMSIMRAEGQPKTPAAAVELLKRARADVEKWMGTFVVPPKPKETLPAGGAATRTNIEPKSPLEAARLGLAGLKAA